MNKNRNIVDQMIDNIENETNLIQFIKKNNIADVSQILSVRNYQKSSDRKGLIVNVKERNSAGSTKILIDIKQGQPTINQIYDSLYGIGKDCDIKVIIHTGGHNDNDNGIPTADVAVVLGLIFQLQDRNVNILLCSYNEENSDISLVDSYQFWCGPNREELERLPTREQFMFDTFWSVYLGSGEGEFYNPYNAYREQFRNVNDWGYYAYDDSEMEGEIEVYWDENGVRYEIKQRNQSDEHLLKFLNHELTTLKDRYGEDSVKFENVVGRLPRLYINAFDLPFSWIYTATPKQLTDFAYNIGTDVWGLRWKIYTTFEKLSEPQLSTI